MAFRSIESDERVCDCCQHGFLSGVQHIDRGAFVAMLCYECADGNVVSKLKALSRRKWSALRDAFLGAQEEGEFQ
jgi:hypothetical protein